MKRSPILEPVAVIATPHPVYGLQWTADGCRLVFAGGFLYGGGFLGLATRDGQILALRDNESLAPEPGIDGGQVIVSAVCIDDSGNWILAAACGYKWSTRGPLLFRIENNSISLVAAPDLPETDDESVPVERATGAWIDQGQLLVRYRAEEAGHVLVRWPAPEPMHADPVRSGHCSSRVAMVDGVAWAAKNQRNRYSRSGTGPPMTPDSDIFLVLETHGLVAIAPQSPGEPILHGFDRSEQTQALIRDRAGKRLFTGLQDSRLVEWRIVASTHLERVCSWQHPYRGKCGAPVARGIQALCQLSDGQTVVSGEVSGSVALWRDATCIGHFVLPHPWSPRSFAAHPTEPLLAVGCKGEQGYEPGSVLLYDLSKIASLEVSYD